MKKVIVLIGRISSWKDYAGDFLASKLWWEHRGISSSLRLIARERGVTESRENLIKIWKEVAKNYGDSYLAEILVNNSAANLLIISWPRQIGQIEYLKNHTDCVIIWIEADMKTRYDRMLKRWKIAENISFEKFVEVEKLEEWWIQDVWRCLDLCDRIIENNWDIEEFERKLGTLRI